MALIQLSISVPFVPLVEVKTFYWTGAILIGYWSFSSPVLSAGVGMEAAAALLARASIAKEMVVRRMLWMCWTVEA